MTLETYLLYLAAVAVFFAHPPGPSQLLFMSNSVQHGMRRGGWTIFGDLTANMLQMIAAAFGLAAVIAASAEAFTAIKWLGVAYLAWIGLRLLISKPRDIDPAGGRTRASGFALFRQGFVTSSANPYAVVFFAALFPQFIDPAYAAPPQVAILGATYLVIDGAILLLWGWLAAASARRVRALTGGLVNRVCGLLMIGAAALLASKDIGPGAAR